jgi:benzoate-CoA ligase family protein
MAHDPFNACGYLLDRRIQSGDGGRTAIVTPSRELTYQGLFDLTRATASALRRLDVRPEERLLLCLLDTPELAASFLAALRIGAVPVPVSTMLKPSEVAALAVDARARLAMVSGELVDVCHELSSVPGMERIVAGAASGSDGTLPWDGVVDADDDAEPYDTWEDSPGFWLYTSGTTGLPKAAMHRHVDLRVTAETYARVVLDIRPEDRCYSIAKLFFAYGLGNSLTFPLAAGASAFLDPAAPSPQRAAENIRAYEPTLFFAVPTFYAALLAADLPADTFSSVRIAVSAGEALPAALYDRFKDRFGVEILDGIGSTEALHIFISNRPGAVRPGTSGMVVDGYECRIRDDDGGPVGVDEPGNLFVRGDSVATGYWCRAEVSRDVFQGRWLRTGDTYTCSSDGYYSYLGRSDDMLKAGGIWVSPFEVEATLASQPDVLEAAVVGADDAEGISKPVAYVVALPGRSPDPDELIAFCRSRLAAFKRPRSVTLVDELPKTATGKIQRYRLRAPVHP